MNAPGFALPASVGTDPDAEALDWFVRSARGLDAAEQRAFDDWLASDPRHARALSGWSDDWSALDALPAAGIDRLRKQMHADKARERAATQVRSAHNPQARPDRHASPTRASVAGAFLASVQAWLPRPAVLAFTLCVSVTSVLVGYHLWHQPVFEQSFATLRGQQMDVELPDGSRMRLDTATQVHVTLYRQRREVSLPEGQAVFQVQGDARRPFEVRAGPATVTVVGTKFSVRHTPDVPGEEGVRVAVEEGHVQVAHAVDAVASAAGAPAQPGTPQSGPAAVALRAGQQVRLDLQGRIGATTPVAASGIAPWRDGRVSFDNVPLAQVLAEFERYGRTGLIVRDDKVAALRLTGTFDPARMANFVSALPKVLPVQLRTRGSFTEIAPL